ncbi:MAG: hypothetical protein GY754_14225 [bacterium]|nr:hypothetical protein [bacterium]
MEIFKIEIGRPFRLENFFKSFKLTWLFVVLGFVFFHGFNFLSMLVGGHGFIRYFLFNFGIFAAFICLLMAYAGVYWISTSPPDETRLTRRAFSAIGKRIHYIIGISLLTLLFFAVVVVAEVGFSSVGYIPYFGPALLSLLTIPLFLVNFICILIGICVLVVMPPMVGEAKSFKDVLTELKILIKERWINVVLYLIISMAILVVCMIILNILVTFAANITHAAQWKIKNIYPDNIIFFEKARSGGALKLSQMKSSIVDIVRAITPRPETKGSFIYAYGAKFTFVIEYIISFSYRGILSLMIAFPLAVYFNISSVYFGRVRVHEDQK